jgi:hypothetical protein
VLATKEEDKRHNNILANGLDSSLTMPSKEVDSSSDDDDSIILEGGKHMY